MEVPAFASLAQVGILLVPVGLIAQPAYETYASELRSFESIRLVEIPVDTKDANVSRFLPNPISTGYLHLSYPTHPPPQSHSSLALIRPSHFPLGVIGIGTNSRQGGHSLRSLHHQFHSTISDIFPSGNLYPLVKSCFLFEEDDATSPSDPVENIPDLVVVPRIANRKLHLGTLLGDFCSKILVELGILMDALENPIGNEYLNACLLPTLPPLSELPSPINGLSSRTSQSSATYSLPDVSKPGFTLSAAPVLKRNASTSANVRQPSLGVQVQKKRLSAIGTASSHGRLYKVLGDLFLMAGRTEDAAIWYNEAIQLLKGTNDILWQATAMEGIATITVIDAWSVGQGLQNSATAVRDPWSDVHDKLQQSINLYLKVSVPDTEQTHSLIAYLYCNTVLKQSMLLFSVWSAKGWGPLAYTIMLRPGPKPYIPPTLTGDEPDNILNLERLSTITGISRSFISASLTQVHGPWLLHLGQRERISILEATASLYACLGYHRKEAYILREVLGCLLDMMVCGREEDGVTHPSTVPQSAGLGIHNVSGSGWGAVGVRLSESSSGNESVLKLLKYVCRVLGLNIEAVALLESSTTPKVDQLPLLNDYDEDIIQELHERRGWPELQVGVVREAVAVAEALPDFPAVAQFALSSLKTLQSVLTPGDQYHLYTTASRAMITARRRGEPKAVDYWSGRPIISISVVPLPAIRLPMEKPRSIQHQVVDVKPLLQGLTDPFLYNPRKAAASQGKSLVVQNEQLEFTATLQNPYIFDLELQEILLSTSGVPFETQSQRVVIPATSLHQVVLRGKATTKGTLTIRGCIVQAPGGIAREYILPLYTDAEEERLARKRSAILAETGRHKRFGLSTDNSTPNPAISKSSDSRPPFRFLECRVVPEQPLLRIRRSSVTHGALMLYDGERSTIRITLENVSPILVDFLRFSFEDSTIEPAQKALSEGGLSVFETYETEYQLINSPVFSWIPSDIMTIAPNQNLTVTLQCFGKVGCTNGTIHVSYAHVGEDDEDGSDVFHVRRVSYPLMVTVYQMLECGGMDILPFPSYPKSSEGLLGSSDRDYLRVDDSSGWCLFSIEVRNTYGSPFDVTLRRTHGDETVATSKTIIPPGSVSRLVIPIQKMLLDADTLLKPIPTLSDRQFVVTQSSLSHPEQKLQRELFWYREELFKFVQCDWHETGGTRSGELSFREQRMTLSMLDTLRLEIARIQLRLDTKTGSEGPVVGHYHAEPNEFVTLYATVWNSLPSAAVFTMDLDISPAEYVVYEGVLSELAVGRLQAGQSREISISLCFLSLGRVDISARVRCTEAPDAESRVVRAHRTVVVKRSDSSNQ
ncbi:TRAPP II complex [Panaeolus papilionaceus]|nr:TRAPP II complex [Panaeolus papilionaceus]